MSGVAYPYVASLSAPLGPPATASLCASFDVGCCARPPVTSRDVRVTTRAVSAADGEAVRGLGEGVPTRRRGWWEGEGMEGGAKKNCSPSPVSLSEVFLFPCLLCMLRCGFSIPPWIQYSTTSRISASLRKQSLLERRAATRLLREWQVSAARAPPPAPEAG